MTREEAIELVCYGDWLNILMSHLGDDDINRLAEAMCIIGSALRPVSREQVEKVWRGEWISTGAISCKCSRCNHLEPKYRADEYNCCPYCMAPMTDEAVDMVMKRLEALKDGSTTD